MAVLAEKSAGDTTIRSFTIETPEADLDDLRARIAATQWPEKETVPDDSQGVPLATMQKLAGYWEYKGGFFNAKGVNIPVAVTVFPGEQYQAPRSWAEQAYPDLAYFNEVDRGGHFAAWEEPELFTDEGRAGFRSLRT